MADIAELRETVANEPTNFEVRWRLAKKLYLACEYQQALDHLIVLKTKWTRRLNVLRYLAASYYRLGMYNEAIEELRDALAMWPTEVGLMEQLARVYEAAGRREEAAAAWEDVIRLKADHPLASSAIRRLRTRSESAVETLRLGDSDSGIHLTTGVTCQECGARNSMDFDRCWQCHALLARTTPRPKKLERPSYALSYWPAILVGVANTLLILAGAGITAASAGVFPVAMLDDSLTVYAVLANELWLPRAVSGVLLLVLWPLTLEFMLRQTKAGFNRPVGPIGTGIFLASLTYITFWAPVHLLPFAPVMIAVVSFVAIVLLLQIEFRAAIQVWAAQAAVALLISVVSLVAFEGLRFIIESPSIVRHAARVDTMPKSRRVMVFEPSTPIRSPMQWESTGSSWLDERGGVVEFTVEGPVQSPPLRMELAKDGETKAFAYLNTKVKRVPGIRIEPGVLYTLVVEGADNHQLRIEVDSPLRMAGAGS